MSETQSKDPGPVRSASSDRPIMPGLWGGLLVVAAACAVWSFAGLQRLAELCGVDEPLSWLFPITLDVAGAVGTRVWLADWSAKETRQYARSLALATLALSVAGNGLSHAMEAYNILAHWSLIASLSAVPPAVLAAMVHLAVMVSTDRSAVRSARPEPDPETGGPTPRRTARRSKDHSVQAGKPEQAISNHGAPATARARAVPGPLSPRERSARRPQDQDLLRQLRLVYPLTGEAPTRNAVMRMFAVGTSRATRLVRLWAADQSEDARHPPAHVAPDDIGRSSPVSAAA